MSHYRLLFPLNNANEIDYYINQVIKKIFLKKNKLNNEIISERILQKLILEDISNFLEELGKKEDNELTDD